MTLAIVQTAQATGERALPMAGWPDWLVLVVGFFALLIGIWIAVKLFKLALWLACIAIVIFAVLAIAGMLLR